MKHKKYFVRIALIFMVVSVMSGCLTYQRAVIKYNVKENLEGSLSVYFYGITSDYASEKNKIKEMEEFYGEYLSYADTYAKMFGLNSYSAQLVNKTQLKCDAVLSGDFYNFVQSIVGFFSSMENIYIEKQGDTFTFKAWGVDKSSTEDKKEEAVIEINYDGQILSNNADYFDEASGIMRWSSKQPKKDGLSFSLKFRKE